MNLPITIGGSGVEHRELPAGVGRLPAGGMEAGFLDAACERDRELWIALWERWPDREVMAHPGFVRLFARPEDRVICAAARTRTGGVLYPVIVRPLAPEPWAPENAPACDLTTAYSYGGPFAWNVTEAEARLFWGGFEAWARSLGAVTSFARLSLFPETQIPFHGALVDHGPNVVRGLEATEEELWGSYEGKVRRNVQRARREGIRVVSDFTGERLDDFHRIYTETMKRHDASSWYFFPRSMFERLIAGLPGRFVFTHAMAGDEAVSSELMLLSERHAYFFLGGTLEKWFPLRPNDLLKHETILLCRSLGKRRLVLGGGYQPDDGLLRYKRAFAPGSEMPFRVGVKTFDSEASARLVEARGKWERDQGREWKPREGYFPPYRS